MNDIKPVQKSGKSGSVRESALRTLGRVPIPEAVLSCDAADTALWLYERSYDQYAVKTELRSYGFSDARYFATIMRDPDGIRQHAEADAIAAGNAEIECQGFKPTVANNAAIDWHAVWAAETRHVIACIEALRRAGYERAAVAIMRELPAPDEPADDVQEEWAMLNRPFDYRMDERHAYALYAESVTDYPMGAAMVSTGYPVKPRKTESERPM
jgi:hypothetical protein